MGYPAEVRWCCFAGINQSLCFVDQEVELAGCFDGVIFGLINVWQFPLFHLRHDLFAPTCNGSPWFAPAVGQDRIIFQDIGHFARSIFPRSTGKHEQVHRCCCRRAGHQNIHGGSSANALALILSRIYHATAPFYGRLQYWINGAFV